MKKKQPEQIDHLINISRYYGANKEYVLAGGGNTSYKDKDTIWVKASGIPLATLDRDGLVALNRKKLDTISSGIYENDPDLREKQVKEDLYLSKLNPEDPLRPSVETSLHNLIRYAFVVHLHPTLVNGLMCGRKSKEITRELFGEETLYIEYTDPGYTLFKKIENELNHYRSIHYIDPQIIFLENHGVFVSADNTDEIRKNYEKIFQILKNALTEEPDLVPLPDHTDLVKILSSVRMLLYSEHLNTIAYQNNKLINHFSRSAADFEKASLPFTPDIIVYCKSNFIYIGTESSTDEMLESLRLKITGFRNKHQYPPRIIMIKNLGLIASGENYKSAETALEVYQDLLKISFYAENFGGPRFMTHEQISFIDTWEVENYRRSIAANAVAKRKMENRIAIITGSAQGFGEGIACDLFGEGANIVIADLNQEKGELLANSLNDGKHTNKALFTRTDVSDPVSVNNLVYETVKNFGGLDLLISNAGILYAGGLDEMDPGTFEKMTTVNYSGYFLCVKYASEIMKLQHHFRKDHTTDIIQINSKSGLKGSKRNFAYAGAKFGGIGLTQSFALELVEYNIKVNSICPGNFFDGPLWSDPENGLFIQYLRTGKVPGAKTIEDVRKYYEQQVPMNRGCTIEDIMKAIYYVIEQTYETGQAIPVTGGQIMIN